MRGSISIGMEHTTPRADIAVASPPMRTLAAAVLAPFIVIALMASPLLIDAVRQAFGQ